MDEYELSAAPGRVPTGAYVKLPSEAFEYVAGMAKKNISPQMSIQFSSSQKHAVLVIDGRSYNFNYENDDNQSHEVYYESPDHRWLQAALIRSKLMTSLVENELSEEHKQKIKQSSNVAEQQRKKHKTSFLETDPNPQGSRRGARSSVKVVSAPKSKLPKKETLVTKRSTVPTTVSQPPSIVESVLRPKSAPTSLDSVTKPKSELTSSIPATTQRHDTIVKETPPTNRIAQPTKLPSPPKQSQEIKEHSPPSLATQPHNVSVAPSKSKKYEADEVRKKVIHMLAIQPQSEEKLGAAVQGGELSKLLPMISILKPEGWTLKKNFFSEVEITWPEYTDSDKTKVKANYKRALGREIGSAPPPQQQISYGTTSSSHPIVTTAINDDKSKVVNGADMMDHSKKENIEELKNGAVKHKVDESLDKVGAKKTKRSSESSEESNVKRLKVEESNGHKPIQVGDVGNQIKGERENNKESVDSLKDTFEKKYKEYMNVRARIEKIRKKFQELGDKMNKAPEWEKSNVNNEIVNLYNKFSKQTVDLKSRYNVLTQELKDLKEKVKSVS